MNIWFGTQENWWLSNLAYRPFEFEGRYYVTVEHAYQSNKSGEFDARTYNKPWKRGSKFVGKRVNRDINMDLMYTLILRSFLYNNRCAVALVETGDKVFTHLQDKGIWKSKFPEMLMDIREYLRGVVDVD